ncbi:MAG TPA: site-specific DNA-methyltransferase [Amycolatopsis sp.]|nr:site-specific DNA-methyltransferase [Amycolatopsis sp.]
MSGSATVLRADARALPLPDASVDLVVTSPPYFALRSYTDGGKHYAGQIGAEATPQEYIASLIACTAEWVRVLKPGGSIWVNLGDKYSQRPGQYPSGNADGGLTGGMRAAKHIEARKTGAYTDMQPKSLILLPERYRIACVDQLGLIARAVVIWSKPNGLPESVTDRVRRSHEDWVHLTVRPRYYSAVDEIRTPASGYSRPNVAARATSPGVKPRGLADTCNPFGALPGSVWEIPTEPLTVPDHLGVDHFAAFPTEWPRRIILGWSPSGICVECDEGRRPVAATTLTADRGGRKTQRGVSAIGGGAAGQTLGRERFVTLTGESCACPDTTAPTCPAIVLDPFGGTGTVALVAKALGRHGISVDRSADYCRLAQWRTTDPAQLAKAMRVEKPPVQMDGQLDLLNLDGVA